MPSTRPASSTRLFVGFACLAFGIAIFAMALLEATEVGAHFRLPGTWYVHRPLWLLIGAGLFAAGWKLQWQHPAHQLGSWQPSRPGTRFERLVLYSREECHLCDDAKEVLGRYAEFLPDIEEIDIDQDPQLQELYGTSIPVVEIDGQIRFRGRVDEVLLRRLIEGSAAVSEPS